MKSQVISENAGPAKPLIFPCLIKQDSTGEIVLATDSRGGIVLVAPSEPGYARRSVGYCFSGGAGDPTSSWAYAIEKWGWRVITEPIDIRFNS